MKDLVIKTIFFVIIIALMVFIAITYTNKIERIENGEITQVSETYMK